MSASKLAKKLGCKDLTWVAEMLEINYDTLQNWYRDKPKLFLGVCLAAIAMRDGAEIAALVASQNQGQQNVT